MKKINATMKMKLTTEPEIAAITILRTIRDDCPVLDGTVAIESGLGGEGVRSIGGQKVI
jgi:hypothetical protein